MRILLTLLAKDFAILRRNRAALILSLGVPMLIIYIVGLVFGLGRTDSGPTGIPLAVVNQSDNPAAQTLVNALQSEKSFHIVTKFFNADKTSRPLTEADLRPMIRDRQFSYALVIPADVVSDTRLGLRLKILSDPRNDIEAQIVNGLLQKTIFSNVPQLLGQSLQARAKKFLGENRFNQFNRTLASAISSAYGGDPAEIQRQIESGNLIPSAALATTKPADPSLRRLDNPSPAPKPKSAEKSPAPDFLARVVALETEQVVGKDVKSPAATRIVGGYAVMFLLFALSNAAAAFSDEQNAGLFQRLLSTPMSRAQLLWSRFLYGVLFGLIQLVVLFYAGHLLYGVDVFGHLGGLLVICTSVAAACTGFGMLLAAITRSAEAARSLG